nr:MAG TPA: hypothetical protein [Caudoviricetes sp.]
MHENKRVGERHLSYFFLFVTLQVIEIHFLDLLLNERHEPIMIFVYNQTNTPQWTVTDKTEKFARIHTVADNKFGLDIFKSDGIADEVNHMDVSHEFGQHFEISKVLNAKTTLRFDHRHYNPFVMPSNDGYNTDVLLVSISLDNGKDLINYYSRDAFIYAYKIDKENQVFHAIISLNTRQSLPFVQFITRSDMNRDVVNRLMIRYSDRRYCYEIINTTMNTLDVPARGQKGYFDISDKRNEEGVCEIRTYRPARHTHTVTRLNEISDEAFAKVAERFHINDKSAKVLNQRDLRAYAQKQHISAITYIIDFDTNTVKTNRDEVIERLAKLGYHYYRTIMVITNDLKIIRMK